MPIPRESYVVSTKCGRYGGGATTEISFDFSAERVTRSVDESLARLKLDYLDIIFCHDIEFASLDQILNETIPALQAVKESGKVRHIGISGLPLKIFRRVHLKLQAIGWNHWFCFKARYSKFLRWRDVVFMQICFRSSSWRSCGSSPVLRPSQPQRHISAWAFTILEIQGRGIDQRLSIVSRPSHRKRNPTLASCSSRDQGCLHVNRLYIPSCRHPQLIVHGDRIHTECFA